jgi:hypothetical protein
MARDSMRAGRQKALAHRRRHQACARSNAAISRGYHVPGDADLVVRGWCEGRLCLEVLLLRDRCERIRVAERSVGGDPAWAWLRDQLRRRGLRLMLDFRGSATATRLFLLAGCGAQCAR